jgi:hypothetical protein
MVIAPNKTSRKAKFRIWGISRISWCYERCSKSMHPVPGSHLKAGPVPMQRLSKMPTNPRPKSDSQHHGSCQAEQSSTRSGSWKYCEGLQPSLSHTQRYTPSSIVSHAFRLTQAILRQKLYPVRLVPERTYREVPQHDAKSSCRNSDEVISASNSCRALLNAPNPTSRKANFRIWKASSTLSYG